MRSQEQMAYDQGHDAATWHHLPITANPYDPNEEEAQYRAWRKGWNDAHGR